MSKARLSDEQTIEWLRLRDSGLTSAQIAERYGVTSERVRTATARVVKDDVATGDHIAPQFYGWFGGTARRASA